MRSYNLIGNIIWIIFGGLFAAGGYLLGGLILCLTIVGLPFGMQCFKLGLFVLSPFGKQAVQNNNASGCLSLLLNVIWIACGGLVTAINHFVFGCILCFTIIGIPFGLQHFKLIAISLMPFGKRIIST